MKTRLRQRSCAPCATETSAGWTQFKIQELHAHVLAAKPAASHAPGKETDVRAASCIHLSGHLAQVYWNSMHRDTWAPSLRDWHEVVVEKAQLRASAPKALTPVM